MDALPIQESKTNLTKEKVCISKNDGISHACGHDAHTAMLLAEAKILNENKEDLNGNIFYCLVLNTAIFRILVHMSSDPYHVVEIFLRFV